MRNLNTESTLLLAIGNDSRRDDGLGWRCLEMIVSKGAFKGDWQQFYQLNIEHAEQFSRYKKVLVIDASSTEHKNGFSLKRLVPENDVAVSTHSVSPGSVLGICQTVYDGIPESWLLEISGYNWEMKTGLSAKARKNLQSAAAYMVDLFSTESSVIESQNLTKEVE